MERTGKGSKGHTQREEKIKKRRRRRRRRRRFLRQVAINGKYTPQMTVVYL